MPTIFTELKMSEKSKFQVHISLGMNTQQSIIVKHNNILIK